MRILFLTEGRTIPSARFRVFQYLRYFEAAGIRCLVRHGYGPYYNFMSGMPRPAGFAYKLAGRLRKTAWLAAGPACDIVFMQRNALPGTAFPEQLLAYAGVPIIYDFDDAVHAESHAGFGRRNGKMFRDMVRLSAEVVAGNEYMAMVANAPEKTTVIPTAVDTSRYSPRVGRKTDELVIGWMGTRPNLVFVESIAAQLFDVLERFPGARLRLVSNVRSRVFAGHAQVEQIPWSEAGELALLQSFDIGIMPLWDDEIAKGKCGFKMLQYMAVGIPVVASRVGANEPLFRGSDGGALVNPRGGDWVTPLSELISDQELRTRQGQSARIHVCRHYSAEKIAVQYIEVFRRAMRHRRSAGTS